MDTVRGTEYCTTIGWQADPTGRYRLRWHDGTNWTADVSDGSAVQSDRLPLSFVSPLSVGARFLQTTLPFVMVLVLMLLALQK